MPPPDLDAWLPRATVRTHHKRAASASPDALWRAAQQIRLADTRTLGHMVRWRIPGTPAERTYHALFRAYPFTVLEEDDDQLVSGLCGRIWTVERDYPRLDGPAEFASWSRRGTVRVLFAHWVKPTGAGAELFSEARVDPVDRQAAIRLKTLWALIGSFERLVGAEPLKLAARRAERG